MQPQNILNVTGNAHCKKMLIAKKKKKKRFTSRHLMTFKPKYFECDRAEWLLG